MRSNMSTNKLALGRDIARYVRRCAFLTKTTASDNVHSPVVNFARISRFNQEFTPGKFPGWRYAQFIVPTKGNFMPPLFSFLKRRLAGLTGRRGQVILGS